MSSAGVCTRASILRKAAWLTAREPKLPTGCRSTKGRGHLGKRRSHIRNKTQKKPEVSTTGLRDQWLWTSRMFELHWNKVTAELSNLRLHVNDFFLMQKKLVLWPLFPRQLERIGEGPLRIT